MTKRQTGVSAPVRFVRVGPDKFESVAGLARRIWPTAFAGMISGAQCDYMLTQRYRPEAMALAIAQGTQYELFVTENAGEVGYGAQGPSGTAGEWKLGQVYLLPEFQGQGIARRYIEHVCATARKAGCDALMLTVNKGNARARAVYEHQGFHIRESATFDIGHGFVMDDFVMVKPLGRE